MTTNSVYFKFEQGFMGENIRCIPMIVRFNLDACGIKLSLKQWSKMNKDERELLATLPAETPENLKMYKAHVEELILKAGGEPSYFDISTEQILWLITDEIPFQLREKLIELKIVLQIDQWKNLSVLQRYALIKLSRPGHENKNFVNAIKEFGLI